MSLRYLIRRRASRINKRKDVQVEIIGITPSNHIHFLMTAKDKGISQCIASVGDIWSLKKNHRNSSLDRMLRL